MNDTKPSIRTETMHRVGGSMQVVSLADHKAAIATIKAQMEALARKWHSETVVATTAFYNASALDKCCHESCSNDLLALVAKVKP